MESVLCNSQGTFICMSHKCPMMMANGSFKVIEVVSYRTSDFN